MGKIKLQIPPVMGGVIFTKFNFKRRRKNEIIKFRFKNKEKYWK